MRAYVEVEKQRQKNHNKKKANNKKPAPITFMPQRGAGRSSPFPRKG